MKKSKLELTIIYFVMSHFSYCPLVWMFHNRKSYNKINKIHERALRIIHKDSTSNFEGLLIKINSVSVHQRNLQLLLIENYKTINNLNPSFMAEVFVFQLFIATVKLFLYHCLDTVVLILLKLVVTFIECT